MTFSAANVGTTYFLNFNGQAENPPVFYNDLSAVATIRLVAIDQVAKTFNFSFAIDNTSSAFTGSRVSVFAFDVVDPAGNPMVNGFGGNSIFNRSGSGTVASLGNREVCLRAGGNGGGCAGGGGNGVTVAGGYSPTQLFKLSFAALPMRITLDAFGIRYQSISGLGNLGSAVGTGSFDSAVPEPGTWAMMIAGFAMVGVSVRRRRAVTA